MRKILFIAFILSMISSLCKATTYTFDPSNSSDELWTSASNWDVYPGLQISAGDSVIISTSWDCIVPEGTTITNYGVIDVEDVGTFIVDGAIENHHWFFLNNQQLENYGVFDNEYLGQLFCYGTGQGDDYGIFDNYGTFNNEGYIQLNRGHFYNTDYATFYCGSSSWIDNAGTISCGGTCENLGWSFHNDDILGQGILYVGGSFDNFGFMLNDGLIEIEYGQFNNYQQLDNNGELLNMGTIQQYNQLYNHGEIINEGNFYAYDEMFSSGSFTNYNYLYMFVDYFGNLTNASGGTIDSWSNADIDVEPWEDFTDTFPGNLTLQDNSLLRLDIYGEQSFQQVNVSDTIEMDGDLQLLHSPNLQFSGCQEFDIFHFEHRTGEIDSIFSNMYGNWDMSYTDSTGTLLFLPQAFGDNYLDFDGVDDYVKVDSSLAIINTLEFKFKPANIDPQGAGEPLMVINGGQAGIYTMNSDANTSGETLVIKDENGNGLYTDYAFTNQWYHVAILSINGLYQSLLVNGIEVNSFPLDESYPSVFDVENLLLGYDDAVDYYEGGIDDVRLWSSTLTSIDITPYYDTSLPANTAGMAAYYTFDQGHAAQDNTCITDCADSSGGEHNGQLFNFSLVNTSSNWLQTPCILPTRTNTYTATAGFWHDASNWSLGIVPSRCQDVVIPTASTVAVEQATVGYCHTLTVEDGARLLLQSQSRVDVLTD